MGCDQRLVRDVKESYHLRKKKNFGSKWNNCKGASKEGE
jgi:hypothetical protein